MSAYTTENISREEAERAVIEAVPKMTNEQLEQALFAIYQDKRLYNYSIVEEEQDQGWPYRAYADTLLFSLDP